MQLGRAACVGTAEAIDRLATEKGPTLHMSKRESFMLPFGTAIHPKLDKTDVYKGKDTKQYRCGQTLPDEALTRLRAKLQAAGEAEGLKGFEIIAIKTDKEGKPFVRASSQYKPPVYDTDNNDIGISDIVVGGGSTLRMYVAINVNKDRKEVGLYLNGVQVKDLKEGKSSPFDKVDGGFKLAKSEEAAAEKPKAPTDGNDFDF